MLLLLLLHLIGPIIQLLLPGLYDQLLTVCIHQTYQGCQLWKPGASEILAVIVTF